MKDERYRAIMEQMGMPDSRLLLVALQQVANETAQEIKKMFQERSIKLIKKFRAESNRSWGHCFYYGKNYIHGYTIAYHRCADASEKLLKRVMES